MTKSITARGIGRGAHELTAGPVPAGTCPQGKHSCPGRRVSGEFGGPDCVDSSGTPCPCETCIRDA